MKKEKEKSELFRIITQISNAGIFYVNDKGQIEIANREARKLFPNVQTLLGGGGLSKANCSVYAGGSGTLF